MVTFVKVSTLFCGEYCLFGANPDFTYNNIVMKWYVVCALALVYSVAYSQSPLLTLSSGSEVEVPTLSPGAIVGFPVELSNSSGDRTLVDLEPSIQNNRYQFIGGSYPGTGGSCGNSLGPGQTCTMMLENLAANMGDYDDNLQFDYAMLWFGGTFPPPRESAEIKIDGYSYPTSCTLAPTVNDVINQTIVASTTESVTIRGTSFSASSVVSIPGLTVSNINVNDFDEIVLDVTAGSTLGDYDIIVSNECGSFTVNNGIKIQASEWIDLRTAAGVAEADPEFTAATINGYTIDANRGMRFNIGSTTWNQAVRFNGACDSKNQSFDIVVYRSGTNDRLLVGLFNDTTQIEPYSGSPAYNKEFIGAWNPGNSVTGLWGSDADSGGSGWSQGIATKNIQNGRYYRYHFERAGQNGYNFEIWRVNQNFNDITQIGSPIVSTKIVTPSTTVCAGISPYDNGNVDYYITGIRVQ